MKKILLPFFIVFMTFTFSSSVKAAEVERIKIEEIEDEEVKSKIKQMYLSDGLLYVNNQKIEEDNGAFSFSLDDIELVLKKVDDHYELTYQYVNVIKNHLWIELTTINGIHTLNIYPNIDSDECIQRQGQIIDNYVYFDAYQDYEFLIDLENNYLLVNDQKIEIEKGSANQRVFFEAFVSIPYISPQYLNQLEAKTFLLASTELYASADIKQLCKNEKIILYNSKSNYEYETTLTKYVYVWPRLGKEDYIMDFSQTRQKVFQYEEALEAEMEVGERKYALFGNNLVYQGVEVIQVEGEVKEKEYGEYSDWYTYYDFTNEIIGLTNIDIETKQMYKVTLMHYPSEYTVSYDEVKASSTREVKTQYRYQTITYSSWTDYLYTQTQLSKLSSTQEWEADGKDFYAKSTGTWSDYSDYVFDDTTQACIASEDCRYKTKTKYAKKTGTWSAYSDYIYNSDDNKVVSCKSDDDCDYTSKTMYAKAIAYITGEYSSYVSSCTVSNEYRCERYYKYTCSNGFITKTKYSTVQYNTGVQGVCDANYTISERSDGYRKQYIEFDEVYDDDYIYDACSDIVGKQKCYAKDKYAIKYRQYTAATDYIYDYCLDNHDDKSKDSVTVCLAKKTYAYSYRSWSAYSSYAYESMSEQENTKWRKITKYRVRAVIRSAFSEWSDTDDATGDCVNKQKRWLYRDAIIDGYKFYDTYQTNSVAQMAYRYREYQVKTKIGLIDAYTLKEKVLEDNLEMTESEINELNEQIDDEIAIAKKIKDTGSLVYVGQEGKLEGEDWLLNQEVFVPYIYVMAHWRAAPYTLNVETLVGKYEEYSEEKENIQNTEIVTSEMVEMEENEGKIIFFDKDNPLSNYETLPNNWDQALINKVKGCNEAQYRITIKKGMIKTIKEWLINNYHCLGQGMLLEMLAYEYSD